MDFDFFWETLDSVLPRAHCEFLKVINTETEKLPLDRSPPSSSIALRMGWGWDGAQEKAHMEDSPLVYYPIGRSLPWPSAICDDLLFRGIELDCREWQSALMQQQPRRVLSKQSRSLLSAGNQGREKRCGWKTTNAQCAFWVLRCPCGQKLKSKNTLSDGEKIFLRLFFLCCFRKKTLKLVSLFIFRH